MKYEKESYHKKEKCMYSWLKENKTKSCGIF